MLALSSAPAVAGPMSWAQVAVRLSLPVSVVDCSFTENVFVFMLFIVHSHLFRQVG